MNFGKYLKHLRRLSGKTLTEIQKEHGVDPGNLCNYEAGKKTPRTINCFIKLAKIYNIPCDRFIKSFLELEGAKLGK